MGIKDYLKESVSTYAFWINPKGQIIGGLKSHIAMVFEKPEKFGLTKEYIDDKYKKYGEQRGVEGKAREEILKELLKEGFIRIRKYRNDDWVININKIGKKNKERITKWAEKITQKGVDGIKASPQDTVRITDMSSYNKKLSLRKLATGILLFESISKDVDIIECRSVDEFDDHPIIV
ncbi:MAG: hypothetical protein ACOCP4_00985 [Candidatus Woesearchaeota archaeon]